MIKKYLMLAIAISVFGCGYNNTELPNLESAAGQSAAANALSFSAIKSQVFEPHCLRCHSQAGGNRAGVNLENYTNVQPLVRTILSVVNSGAMPPNGGLPANMKSFLTAWVGAGAPENINDGTGTPPNTPPTPPISCKVHMGLVSNGIFTNIDENFYIENLSQKIKRRNDDCDDRQSEIEKEL